MNTRILNREGKLPQDGWFNIEATGEHVNHASKVVLVIDDKTRTSIANRFAAEAEKAGADFAGLSLDKDHLSQSEENSTEAYGWAMQIRNRDNLLEARIDWTALGLPLIESKPGVPPAYKFFSTEYDPCDCEKMGTRIVNKKTYDVVRPLRLDGLSLTNDPNNKGQRPISNRKSANVADREETKTMKTLLKKMGLAEDASEESAVTALELITNRATKAEASVTALTAERDTLLTAQVDSDLEKYKNRFKPADREKIKAQLIKNRATVIELWDSSAPVEVKKTITNRTGALPPAGEGAAEPDAAAVAKKITNRANELKGAAPTRPFESCWQQAQNEAAEAAS